MVVAQTPLCFIALHILGVLALTHFLICYPSIHACNTYLPRFSGNRLTFRRGHSVKFMCFPSECCLLKKRNNLFSRGTNSFLLEKIFSEVRQTGSYTGDNKPQRGKNKIKLPSLSICVKYDLN